MVAASSTASRRPIPALRRKGLKNGQNVDVLTGLANSFGITSTTGVAGGPYALSVAGALTNANYRVTARNDASWTVTPASIVVTANGGTSVYGSAPCQFGPVGYRLAERRGRQCSTRPVAIRSATPHDHWRRPRLYALNVLGTLTNPNYHIAVVQSRELDRHSSFGRRHRQWWHIGLWQFAAQSRTVGHRFAERSGD